MHVEKKSMKLKISLVIFLVFVTAFSSLYFLLDFYKTNYDMFFIWSNEFKKINWDEKEKLVFIIGSSQSLALDPTIIEDNLLKGDKNIRVFNLAQAGDVPTKRIGDINEIISLQPKLIVYGVGLRDFYTEFGMPETFLQSKKSSYNFPEPWNDLKHYFKISQPFFSTFETPRIVTLTWLKDLDKPNITNNIEQFKSPFSNADETSYVIADSEKIQKSMNRFLPLNNLPQQITENEIYLKNIIQILDLHDIQLVIFVPPMHKLYSNQISEIDENFQKRLLQISLDTNTPLYFLDEASYDKEIWFDAFHVSHNRTVTIYNEDITKIIQKEI